MPEVLRHDQLMTLRAVDQIPRQVLLFSGHMVDAPDRKSPRFPADKVPIAGQAIDALLAELSVGLEDLAICGGACGGDLLFAKSSLERDASLEIYLPFDKPTFLSQSVDFAGANWRSCFDQACAEGEVHVMPDERGPLPQDADPFEQNNLWMLEAANRFGGEKVHFICLWNGQGGDGPGGTQHLMGQIRELHGQTHWLDTRSLWS